MARIETYDIAFPVVLSDKLVGTDTSTTETKNFTVGDVISLVGSGSNTEYNLSTGQNALNVDINLNDTVGGQTKATLVPSGSITLTDLGSNQIRISSIGEANTATNLGAGLGIFAQKAGSDLEFKSLTPGANVSINDTGAEIEIASVNDNTTYELVSAQNGNDVKVTLDGSDGTANVVKLVAGTNITLTDNASNEVTITSADNNTTYDLGAVGVAGNISVALTGSDGTNDVVQVTAGANITLTDNGGNEFTIDSSGVTSLGGLTDTNITNPVNNDLLIYDSVSGKWVNSQLTVTGQEKLIQTCPSQTAAVNTTVDLLMNAITGNFNTGSVHLNSNNLVPQSNGAEIASNMQVKISATVFLDINHASDEITFVIYESGSGGGSIPLQSYRVISDKTGKMVFSFYSHFDLIQSNVIKYGFITPVSNNLPIGITQGTEFEIEVLR